MVGRSAELAQLREALTTAQDTSTAQVVTVIGQAGIGKSRLVHEFLREARRSAIVIRGRCLPYGESITYLPIADLIREAAGITRKDSPAAAAKRVEALVDELDEASLITKQLLALAALDNEVEAPAEAAWAMRRLLEHLGATRPVVAVVDDIQWASPAAMELLDHVAERARSVAILLVCMARPEVGEVHPAWPRDRPMASTIKLRPLTTHEGARLVDELLGGLPLGRGARERIAVAADGNPLFIEQLLAMLQDRGILARVEGAWVARGDLAEVEIPPSIAALLAARIDRLPGVERATLECASVAGKAFSDDLVAGLAPVAIRRPRRAPWRHSSMANSWCGMRVRWRTRGASASATCSSWMPPMPASPRRTELACTRPSPIDSRPKAPPWDRRIRLIVGYHLEQACLYRQELRDAPADVRPLARRAIAYLGPAGEAAYDRGDVRAAVPLLRRVVGIAGPGDTWRGRSLYCLARALRAAGEQVEAHQMMDLADAAQRECPDPGLGYRIRISQTVTVLDRGERDASVLLELSQEAYDDARSRGDGSDMLNALTYIGGATLELYGVVAEEPIHLQAVALARELGLDRRADRALGIIANRLPDRADPGRTRRSIACRGCSWTSAARTSWRGRSSTSRSGPATRCRTGSMTRGAASRAADRIADEVGEVLPLLAADWPSFVCFVERTAGEPRRAEAIARWSCAELDRLDDPYHLAAMLLELATVLMAQGRLDEVPALIDRSRADHVSDDQVAQLYLRLTQAELLNHLQRHGDAVLLAREAAHVLRAIHRDQRPDRRHDPSRAGPQRRTRRGGGAGGSS